MRSDQSASRIVHAAKGCATVLIALFLTCTAQAEELVEFRIPPQSLETALLEFSDQTGTQVATSSVSIAELRTKGVSGRLTPRAALERLIEGSNLEIRSQGERSFSLIGRADVEDPKKKENQLNGAARANYRDVSTISRRDAEALEEVIVTAQKREERLLDVPQSITVLSAGDLQRLGATEFRDFASNVPGLTYATAGIGFTQISIRGVTTGLDVGPTVGVYVDEVPYGASGPSTLTRAERLALDVGLFDVDRIEVLKGPQGTLYGASAMGGLVKYVTKQPDLENTAFSIQAGLAGTHDGDASYNAAFTANAPVFSGSSAIRTSAFYSHDGGYIDNLATGDNDVNSADVKGGRLDFLVAPNSALRIRLTGFVQDISRDGMATADFRGNGTPVDGTLDQRRPFAEPFDQRFRLVSGAVSYDFGGVTLTSISSYQTVRSSIVYDLTASYVPILNPLGGGPYGAVAQVEEMTTDKFTQEVRLATLKESKLDWLIGGFYTNQKGERDAFFALRTVTGATAPNTFFTTLRPSRYEESAAFGDLTYHITVRFDVTGGIRYTKSSLSAADNGFGSLVRPFATRRSSEHVVNYLASARYRVSDHATAYTRFATGYRPGGPNAVIIDPATGLPASAPTYKADRLKNYEVGLRAESADQRFGVDVAAYFIKWTDIQVVDLTSAFGGLTNGNGARLRGADLELRARPVDRVAINWAAAYQRAELDGAAPSVRGVDGERLPNVPQFTTALSADYQFALASRRAVVGASLRYIDDRKATFGTTAHKLPAYTTADLRFGLELQRVSLNVYARNMFDERGQLSAYTFSGSQNVAILQPRTIGITAMTQF